MVELASAVRARRRHLHLTQEELADLAHVSERTVRAIEAGKRSVQLDTAEQVLRAIGLELGIQNHIPEALR